MQSKVFQTLVAHPLLQGTDINHIQQLGLRPQMRRLQAGQTVFERDDQSRSVCLVDDGALLAVLFDTTGRELTFARINSQDYFGELAAIDGQARSLTVYALTEASLIILEPDDFQTLLTKVPQVQARVLSDLVGLVRKLTDKSYQLAAMSVETRVRSYLVRLALQGNALRSGAVIPNVPTHSEIANTIGANREAVSRAVSSLKRSGVIDAGRQKITVLQSESLLHGLAP